MSGGDDWQPGDLALCVDDDPGDIEQDGVVVKLLERGRIYEVEELDADPAFAEIGLHLVGVPRPWSAEWKQHIGWSELRFRKIRPHVPDEEDAETIRLLTGTPVKEPVA